MQRSNILSCKTAAQLSDCTSRVAVGWSGSGVKSTFKQGQKKRTVVRLIAFIAI